MIRKEDEVKRQRKEKNWCMRKRRKGRRGRENDGGREKMVCKEDGEDEGRKHKIKKREG